MFIILIAKDGRDIFGLQGLGKLFESVYGIDQQLAAKSRQIPLLGTAPGGVVNAQDALHQTDEKHFVCWGFCFV